MKGASMRKFDLRKMLTWLGFMLHCPVCNVKYDFSDIKIVDSEQDEQFSTTRLLVHSDCHKCKSSVMFNIDINGQDVFTIIAKTDLTSTDTEKFRDLPALDTNDIIQMHQSLQRFNGDFKKIFKFSGK